MWNVLSSIGPGARAWNQVSYDGRPLLAGGATGGGRYSNDFWGLEGDVWREIIPHDGAREPVSREHHSFVHCPKDGKHYFWQGHMGTLANDWATDEQRRKIWRINGETWEFTGGILAISSGLRMSGGNCWCPPLDGFLSAGGGNLDPTATYLLRHSDMQQVELATIGNPYSGSANRFNVNNQMQWVAEMSRAALFGGHNGSVNGVPMNDLMLFDPTPATPTWRLQRTTNTPLGRGSAALVYRPGRLAVFGGTGTTGTRFKDFWELDLATSEWTRLDDAPFDYYFHGGAWDGTRYVFFGGFSSDPSGSGRTLTYSPSGAISINVPMTLHVEVIDV